MMKLKSIRRGVGLTREKATGAPRPAPPRRGDEERSQQRVWSLLLPPAYFPSEGKHRGLEGPAPSQARP